MNGLEKEYKYADFSIIDIIEEKITLGNINLLVVDTAGIRETEDVVESIGVKYAIEYAENADLILYVVDSSKALDENDMNIITMLKNKKSIVLLNKQDLEIKVDYDELVKLVPDSLIIKTSMLNELGIEELEDSIMNMFTLKEIDSSNEVMITNERHKEALSLALSSISQVKNSIELELPEDFYSIDLMSAYASLGSIIGEEVSDDLVNEIFSKFCMGK